MHGRLWLGAAMAVLGLLLAGCSASVRAPGGSAGVEPRPVFFLERGWHSSLVLTRDDGSLVRWVYGDWRWYALNDTGALRAVPTLFWPTQGALGRRALEGPATARSVEVRVPVRVDAAHELAAPPEAVDALLAQLDERFAAARGTRHFSRRYVSDQTPEFLPPPVTSDFRGAPANFSFHTRGVRSMTSRAG